MPLALINLVTRLVLVVVAVVVVLLDDDDDEEEETTNTILAMSSILIWNSKDASILANVSKRPPDLGEILLAWKIGPSWDVDSSMAPLPMTMIRKDNFDL